MPKPKIHRSRIRRIVHETNETDVHFEISRTPVIALFSGGGGFPAEVVYDELPGSAGNFYVGCVS